MRRFSDDDDDEKEHWRRLKVALACAIAITTLAAVLGFWPTMP
jgi:hypothetical protein